MRPVAPSLRIGLFAAAAALVLAAQPASAATALNGALNVVANAMVDDGGTVSNVDNQSWSGAPTTLNAHADSEAANTVSSGFTDTVDVFGTAQATWASANAGSVAFTGYGWNFDTTTDNTNNEADLTQNRGGSDWSYTFTATGNGVISMAYDVTGTGDLFGLWGWNIDFTGSGSGGPVLIATDPTNSGVFTGVLVQGQTYTISLDGNPNIATQGASHFAGSMDGTFDWRIDERPGVPEPTTWALMLGGFGLAGAALRRRRTAPATA